MRVLNTDELHISIDSTIECKICGLRIDAVVRRVVNENQQLVLVLEKMIYPYLKGRIPSIMQADTHIIEIDIGAGVHTAELNVQFLAALEEGGAREMLSVTAYSAIIVVPSILTVHTVPRVGDSDSNRLKLSQGCLVATAFEEIPLSAKNSFFSHICSYSRMTSASCRAPLSFL
jgi:hypothetical protein